MGVPTVDLHDFELRFDAITAELMQAAETVGFLQIVGHGMDQAVVDKMFEMSKAFFAMDDEVKAKYPFKSWNAGWEKLQQVRPSTGTPDQKESYQIGYGSHLEAVWPAEAECPGFRAAATAFMAQAHEVSCKLLRCFAAGLGFAQDAFASEHDPRRDDVLTALRILHYPECTGTTWPANYWRAGAHTDFDMVTLLFQRQGQAGLEMVAGRDSTTQFAWGDTWVPVEPVEAAICVNIGDMLMRWSDDRLKSNFHRVRAPQPGEYQGPRYSIAYFNQCCRSTVIQGPGKTYEPITAEEFLKQALQRNYAALTKLREAEAAAAAAAAT